MLGDPAGETLAEGAGQQLHVDLLVGADAALEGDRDDLVRQLDQVDPGVVVVDDPARLLDDRPADLGRGAVAAHPGGGGLEDLELGGARLGLLEQLGIGEGDGGVRGQGRDERHVAARPVARLTRDRGQRAEDPVVVDERRDQMAGDLERGVVAAPWREVARRERRGRRGRGRCAGPRRPSPRRGGRPAASRPARRGGRPTPRPRGVSSCRTRIVVASARRARFVSSTTIRNRSARSCEAARRPAMPRTVSRRSASSASRAPPDGAAALVRVPSAALVTVTSAGAKTTGMPRSDRVSRRTKARAPATDVPSPFGAPGDDPAPGRGIELLDWARAHVSMVALRTSREVPPTVPVTGRTMSRVAGPTRGSVDRPKAAGLHSGGVAAPRGHDRQIPHPRSARPVDDGPSPIDGTISRHHPEPGPSRLLTADRDHRWSRHPRRDVPHARWQPCST